MGLEDESSADAVERLGQDVDQLNIVIKQIELERSVVYSYRAMILFTAVAKRLSSVSRDQEGNLAPATRTALSAAVFDAWDLSAINSERETGLTRETPEEISAAIRRVVLAIKTLCQELGITAAIPPIEDATGADG